MGVRAGPQRISEGWCLPKEGVQALRPAQLVPWWQFTRRIFKGNHRAALVFQKNFAIDIVSTYIASHDPQNSGEKGRADIVTDEKMKAWSHTGRRREKPSFADSRSSALCSIG